MKIGKILFLFFFFAFAVRFTVHRIKGEVKLPIPLPVFLITGLIVPAIKNKKNIAFIFRNSFFSSVKGKFIYFSRGRKHQCLGSIANGGFWMIAMWQVMILFCSLITTSGEKELNRLIVTLLILDDVCFGILLVVYSRLKV